MRRNFSATEYSAGDVYHFFINKAPKRLGHGVLFQLPGNLVANVAIKAVGPWSRDGRFAANKDAGFYVGTFQYPSSDVTVITDEQGCRVNDFPTPTESSCNNAKYEFSKKDQGLFQEINNTYVEIEQSEGDDVKQTNLYDKLNPLLTKFAELFSNREMSLPYCCVQNVDLAAVMNVAPPEEFSTKLQAAVTVVPAKSVDTPPPSSESTSVDEKADEKALDKIAEGKQITQSQFDAINENYKASFEALQKLPAVASDPLFLTMAISLFSKLQVLIEKGITAVIGLVERFERWMAGVGGEPSEAEKKSFLAATIDSMVQKIEELRQKDTVDAAKAIAAITLKALFITLPIKIFKYMLYLLRFAFNLGFKTGKIMLRNPSIAILAFSLVKILYARLCKWLSAKCFASETCSKAFKMIKRISRAQGIKGDGTWNITKMWQDVREWWPEIQGLMLLALNEFGEKVIPGIVGMLAKTMTFGRTMVNAVIDVSSGVADGVSGLKGAIGGALVGFGTGIAVSNKGAGAGAGAGSGLLGRVAEASKTFKDKTGVSVGDAIGSGALAAGSLGFLGPLAATVFVLGPKLINPTSLTGLAVGATTGAFVGKIIYAVKAGSSIIPALTDIFWELVQLGAQDMTRSLWITSSMSSYSVVQQQLLQLLSYKCIKTNDEDLSITLDNRRMGEDRVGCELDSDCARAMADDPVKYGQFSKCAYDGFCNDDYIPPLNNVAEVKDAVSQTWKMFTFQNDDSSIKGNMDNYVRGKVGKTLSDLSSEINALEAPLTTPCADEKCDEVNAERRRAFDDLKPQLANVRDVGMEYFRANLKFPEIVKTGGKVDTKAYKLEPGYQAREVEVQSAADGVFLSPEDATVLSKASQEYIRTGAGEAKKIIDELVTKGRRQANIAQTIELDKYESDHPVFLNDTVQQYINGTARQVDAHKVAREYIATQRELQRVTEQVALYNGRAPDTYYEDKYAQVVIPHIDRIKDDIPPWKLQLLYALANLYRVHGETVQLTNELQRAGHKLPNEGALKKPSSWFSSGGGPTRRPRTRTNSRRRRPLPGRR
jgi:hypothetical protein